MRALPVVDLVSILYASESGASLAPFTPFLPGLCCEGHARRRR